MKKLYIGSLVAFSVFLAGCQMAPVSDFLGTGAHSDAGITNAVSAAFTSNPQLAGLPIRIETDHANVRLSGYVKTIRQSDVAGDVASKVDGVKFVENNLIVRK